MCPVSINVETDALQSAKTKVQASMVEAYDAAVSRLYSDLHALDASWSGTDSDEFLRRIDACKPGLDDVKRIAQEYMAAFDSAVSAYQSVDSQVSSLASRLPAQNLGGL